VSEVAREDLRNENPKDEDADDQIEQAERAVGAAAEQWRSWGPAALSFLQRCGRCERWLPSGLDGLEPKERVA
jgi:hypothetical protein